MSSGFMVALHCVLVFYILGLLQDVSGYVAQLPSPLATTGPNLTSAVTDTSRTIFLNGASTELSQEEPPFDFRVEYFWKAQGVAFNRLALFNTILYDMAFSAFRDWNSFVHAARLPAKFQIAINFVADRSGPGLKVKHVLWALEEMFDIFEEQKRYAPGNVVVAITPRRLGVGNVQFSRSVSTPINLMDIAPNGVPDATLEGATLPPSDKALDTGPTLTLNEPGNSSIIHPISQNEFLSLPDISVDFRYRDNGVTIHDAQIFNTSLKTVIKAAEPSDKLGSIGPILATYNEMDNFTFSIVSEPFVKEKALTWMDCINSIVGIVLKMASKGPDGRWGEIDGFIRDGGVVVGRFCIDKGDLTRLDSGDVCTVPFPGSVNVS